MRAATLAMARRILVDGLSAAAAGREFDRPRDVASRAAGRIRAEALREHACPECGRGFEAGAAVGKLGA